MRTPWYLQDAVEHSPQRHLVTPHDGLTGFPRASGGSLKMPLTAQEMSTLLIVAHKPTARHLEVVPESQALNPRQLDFRIVSQMGYQGATNSSVNGVPFVRTGGTTDGFSMFAGHWIYGARTELVSDISETTATIQVADATKLTRNRYAVIRSADGWGDAEHVLILGTDLANGTATIARAHRSEPRAHPAGSFIAMHAVADGDQKIGWAYHVGTNCPVDEAGNRWIDFLAKWTALNYDKDGQGNPLPYTVHGVKADADPVFSNPDDDYDNDGVADGGVCPLTQQSWRVNGLAEYFMLQRDALDTRGHINTIIMSGDAHAVNWGGVSAIDDESAPLLDYLGADDKPTPDFGLFSSYISAVNQAASHATIGPFIHDVQSRCPSLAYPMADDPCPTANAKRLAIAFATYIGGYFCDQNYPRKGAPADRWQAIMAVNTDPGPDYGKCIPKTDYAGRIKYGQWLGAPLGLGYRIVGEEFADDMDMLPSAYRGEGCIIDSVETIRVAIVPPLSSLAIEAANIVGPSLKFVAGESYTLCFSAYSDTPRQIAASIGGTISRRGMMIPGGNVWSRQVFCFQAQKDIEAPIRFLCGVPSGVVQIKHIKVFHGDANLFRRDYQRGVVLINAGPMARTVELDGEYLHPLDYQDPIGDGIPVTSVTLDPWDGRLLLKQQY